MRLSRAVAGNLRHAGVLLLGTAVLAATGLAATIDTATQTQTFGLTNTDFTIPLTFNQFVSPDSSLFPFLRSVTISISETVTGQATITNLAESGAPNDYTEQLSVVTTVTGPDLSTLFSSGAGGFSVDIPLSQIAAGQSKTGSTTNTIDPITQVFLGPDFSAYEGAGTFVVSFSGTGLSETVGPTPLSVTDAVTSASGTVSIFATYDSVPEPAPVALLGLGIIGIGFLSRRRFKKLS